MSSFTVTVPATTANLGPGFDCLGAALSLYNHFTFTPDSQTSITVTGSEAPKLITDKTNLLYQSFLKVYEHLGQNPPPVALTIDLGVPLARGLGSSATAIVGGLMGANVMAGNPLSQQQLLELAIAMEGHPDNVVPAFLGNCQLSVGEKGNWQICQVPWHEDIIPVVGIPDFELSTTAARAVLPESYSRGEAIFNIAHLGLLIRALETGNADWLKKALADKIHQPYRQDLIKGYEVVKTEVLLGGAYGMVISGAGPTLLTLCDRAHLETVTNQMGLAWSKVGINAEIRALSLDNQGATISHG